MQTAMIAAGIAFAVSLALAKWLSRLRFAMDIPNHRSQHNTPVPRSGGLAIVCGFWAGMAILVSRGHGDGSVFWDDRLAWAIISAVTMSAAGLADDLWNLTATKKLLAQIFASSLAVSSGIHISEIGLPGGGKLELGFWGVLMSGLWLMVCTNAVNFLDGADGLLAKALIPGFLGTSVLAFFVGIDPVGFVALMAGMAVWGFYVVNRAPARIFMGDSGSQFLGMLVGCLTIIAAPPVEERFSLLVVPLAFLPVLFDACFTVARRAAALQPVWQAHRTHLFQFALRAGMTQLQVSRVYLALALFSLGCGGAIIVTPAPWHHVWVAPALLAHFYWLAYVNGLRLAKGLPWNDP